MPRLTDEEREFRREGRGIPFSRWWPFLAIFVAGILAPTATPDFIALCTGYPLEVRGKGVAAIRLLLTVPCSPFLFAGGPWGWMLFLGIWMPVPFAVVNWRWAKRSNAYWAKVSQRDNERRRLKRAEKRGE